MELNFVGSSKTVFTECVGEPLKDFLEERCCDLTYAVKGTHLAAVLRIECMEARMGA